MGNNVDFNIIFEIKNPLLQGSLGSKYTRNMDF
jgi:hypothetical protein